MGGKRVTYDDAVERALNAGFEAAFSSEDWKGTWVNGKKVKYPWTHLECGETRPQTFHHMLKGQCRACKEVSYDDAVARALKAGFEAAFSKDEWQGTQQVKYPWTHLKCGETRWQTFGNMLKGKCRACSTVSYDEAVARALKAGFEAAFSRDEWKGSRVDGKNVKYPWTHLECGETRWQQFHHMLKGMCGGCNTPNGGVTYDIAVARARKAGFAVPFDEDAWQGTQVNGKTVTYLWTHLACGSTRPQTFHHMLKGHCGGCNSWGKQKMAYDEAVARARKAGFKAAFSSEDWKGTWVNDKHVKYPWTHQKCGKTRPQAFHQMLNGHCAGCKEVSYDEAVARARKAGFKAAFSNEDWKGTWDNGKTAKYPWTHLECGETRPQEFHNMLQGTCGKCGIDNTGPSTVYVVWHPEWNVGK
jgi:uncharacterized protein YjlB